MQDLPRTKLGIEGEVLTLPGRKYKFEIVITMNGKPHRRVYSTTKYDSMAKANKALHKKVRDLVKVYGSLSIEQKVLHVEGIELGKLERG